MAKATPTQPYVLVVGAAGIDSKGKAKTPLTVGTSTPGTIRISVGGTARNVADNLARLDVEAVLFSAVGNDSSGRRIIRTAERVGINTDYLIISEKHHTPAYLALLDEAGNLVMSVADMQALDCLTPKIIKRQRALIKAAKMMVLDSNLSEKSISALFKIAKRYKIPICADPASTTLATKLKAYLPNIYMITPNIPEAEILSGIAITDENDAVTAARALVNAGVDVVIITLGAEGVVYATTDASGHIPAVAVEVIDTTGASDALTATVVFGLLNDIPIDESVRLAASTAALTLACTDTVCTELSLDWLYDQLLI